MHMRSLIVFGLGLLGGLGFLFGACVALEVWWSLPEWCDGWIFLLPFVLLWIPLGIAFLLHKRHGYELSPFAACALPLWVLAGECVACFHHSHWLY